MYRSPVRGDRRAGTGVPALGSRIFQSERNDPALKRRPTSVEPVNTLDPTMNDDEQVLVSAETANSFERRNLLTSKDDTDSKTYPRLANMSAAFIYKAIARPTAP